MDYLQRLLHRALAVPREQAQSLFDPFEQVAAWTLEPPSAAKAATGIESPAQASPPVGPLDTPSPLPQRAAPPAAREANAAPAVPPSPRVLPTPALSQPAARHDDTEASPADAPKDLTPQQAALLRVDGFMQSLGMAVPIPEPPAARPARTPQREREDGPSERPRPARRAMPAAAEPVIVRPVRPRTVEAIDAPLVARRPATPRATDAAASPTAVPTQQRGIPHAAPEHIVQTTVVVAPPAHRLDELAHSTRISRFGIGQS